MSTFPFYKQLDSMDCGPTCLRMIAKHYGKSYNLPFLREKCYIDKTGVSLKGISEAAELIGLRTVAIKLKVKGKRKEPSLFEAPLPAILHWNQNHFVVIYKMTNSHIWIADPADGKHKLSIEDLNLFWTSDKAKGIVLLIEPTNNFHDLEIDGYKRKGFGFLGTYLKPHSKLIFQLMIGLFLGTLIQLIFPFLTQSLVDIGIDTKNLNFIYIVLAGQLMLFLSATMVRFLQSWILLHISVRMNVSLIADFLIKLMHLPLGFFDSKNTGDLLQRIGDHKRIENFLTNSSLNVLLSITNLLVFGFVLAVYSIQIFLIFLISSALYLVWIFVFLRMRKEVDYRSFQQMADNQDSLIEMIQGMQEIKLQGSQLKRRWQWTNIQVKLFQTQMKALAISQYQDAGALSINQLKDILITFFAAKLVLDGAITLGMMLAIQYIIGQLNGPLQQLIGFIRSAQDARISLERLSEIHSTDNEEVAEIQKLAIIPPGDIIISNLNFKYTPISQEVLKNISMVIPRGKTTAIVGASGSGKTTLIKLLLGFYNPSSGNIRIGSQDLTTIYNKVWRAQCGVVMQEGFIFSDTIANNIAESDSSVNYERVFESLTKANVMDFILTLPLGINTMIGPKGNGISQGQRQRLFIARAIYKNPEFLFFDEATNSLDATNERVIMDNLNQFLEGKTAVVVAHRLSTVKNADQIIVLDQGAIVEVGTHQELVKLKGTYFNLVKNQLELGN